MNKKGSVYLVILVGILALSTLIASTMLVGNEKYSNVQMVNRITSRYLAESSIDIQKYLLHNKFDNTEIKIYFVEDKDAMGADIRRYYKSSPIFRPEEIDASQGIEAIEAAVDRSISEVGKNSSLRDFKVDVNLSDPDNSADTEIDYLCNNGSFLIERVGEDAGAIKCTLQDMYFSTKIKYVGGTIQAIIRVSGLEAIRDTYQGKAIRTAVIDGSTIEVGTVNARLDTSKMEITTYSFQNY